MPIFIIFCIVLTTLVQTQSVYLPFLNDEPVWMAGGVLALLFLLAGCFKRLDSGVWHDGFACGVLWAWYGYWEPLFSKGSPMFHVFPIYYALLCGWMWFAFINKAARFDAASRDALRYLQTYLARFDACWLAGAVLASLAFPEHYLLYPILMTLFVVRSTFQRCLEIIDAAD
jgi:hypothetical protein